MCVRPLLGSGVVANVPSGNAREVNDAIASFDAHMNSHTCELILRRLQMATGIMHACGLCIP